jgi:hypothetical protein
MKTGKEAISPENECIMPSQASDERVKTLFVHVPKSGGTTLDCIFRDHFYDTPLYPLIGPEGFGLHLARINHPDNWYVGGHIPVATINGNQFKNKVTILRDPLETICSSLSFFNKIYNLPENHKFDHENNGQKMAIFEKYYTQYFDTKRYLIDLNYGVGQGLDTYIDKATINEVIENTNKFNYVFDFANLNSEIQHFIIDNNYFPYYAIDKKRHYAYQPDFARAKMLLNQFDEEFYQALRSRFRHIPENIQTRYQQYREDYCKNKGIKLEVRQGKQLNLRCAIGSGWFNVEHSDLGNAFRWSEDKNASLEIPIASAGLYAIYLYITPGDVENFQLDISTLVNEHKFTAIKVVDSGIQIFKAFVFTRSHDWIHINIDIYGKKSKPAGGNSDVRSLGIALGHVYISRQPL